MIGLSQKQVWNKIASDWNKVRNEPRKEVLEFIDSCNGKLLDLGCGSGRHFVRKEGLDISGVDFSDKMIELARQNAISKKLNIDLKLIDGTRIPYGSDFFDNVICIAVLHCIEDRADRLKLLKEIKRVLKPGGKALIQVWSKNHKRVCNKGKEAFIPWTVGKEKVLRYYYLYDLNEIKSEIKLSGFKILNEKEDENISLIISKD